MRRISACAATAAFALLLSAGAAEAQTIGFKLGAAMSNFSTNDDGNIDGKTGFVGGGFVRFPLGPVNLQPELLTVSKGAKSDGVEDAGISLEYVEIPVLLHLPFALGALSPYVIAGPAFAFEVGCDVETPAGDVDCDSEPDGSDRNKTDIGIAAGAGLEFPMGPGAISVEGRYTWGTTNLNGDSNDAFSIKNRAAYLTAGYTIWLGRR